MYHFWHVYGVNSAMRRMRFSGNASGRIYPMAGITPTSAIGRAYVKESLHVQLQTF